MSYLLVSLSGATLFALTLAFFLPGVIIGRWLVLVAPIVIWTMWAIGRRARWWWDDSGEILVLETFILAGGGVASAAAGVLIHRVIGSTR